jgi:leucyl aminopeptidase
MKTDMTGAAAVMGTMAAIRDLRLPIRVVGILACAENMPSGSAMRPGDVIRHYGGRTTEILNTDAEGRLVLADCLAYAAARLDPRYLIDIASLTGSATVGLGRYHAAMYGTDNHMLGDLEKAAEVGDDPVWRMPLVPDYSAGIATPIADAANSNTDPSISAGSITAALFLKPFAGNTKWAHLDIAGVARSESDRPETRRGATGYGVSLLTNWLQALSDR